MCTENLKEKTELLYALINGRKASDLPKISQVRICVYITTVLDVLTFCFVLREVWFYLQLNNMIVAYCVHLAAILDNLGQDRVFPLELGLRLKRSVRSYLSSTDHIQVFILITYVL
jgi:hypothetical protein